MKDVGVEEMMNERYVPTVIMKEGRTSEQQLHCKQYADNCYSYITAFHSDLYAYHSTDQSAYK